MSLDPVANLKKLTLSQGYGSTDTTIVVTSGGSSLPTSGSFNMIWWNSTDYSDPSLDPNVEIVRVNGAAISGNSLPVTRGQEGIAASTKNTAGKTYSLILGITAKMITDIGSNLRYAWHTPGALTGTINGSNAIFTLPWTPNDPNSVIVYQNQQPFFAGIHFTVSGNQITYMNAFIPGSWLSSSLHVATGQ